MLKIYWLNHDAKGTRGVLCFLVLYWVVSLLFQLSLAVLSLSLLNPFSSPVLRWKNGLLLSGGVFGDINRVSLGLMGGLEIGRAHV